MNDQYVTMQDFRIQLDSVVEGIRVLNEHIEEYDKRLEGVQTSTQQIIAEVQAENNRKNDVICQALDTMHDKISNEVNAKLDTVALSSASALASPRLDSPRPILSPLFPTNSSNNAINSKIIEVKKAVNEIHGRLQPLTANYYALQAQMAGVLAVPAQMQNFVNDISARFQRQNNEQQRFADALRNAEANLWENHQKHVKNSDNNFRETAIHMDSVKKRFAEHRRTLDDLITAWKDSTNKLDQLQMKFEALKDFTSTKLVPTIANLSRRSSPTTIDPNQLRPAITAGHPQTNGTPPREGGGQTDGPGGPGVANNPIEV